MRAISNNIQKSLDNMSERESDKAISQQQLVMTSANNLALMLSDVLQSMQEDLAKKPQANSNVTNLDQATQAHQTLKRCKSN